MLIGLSLGLLVVLTVFSIILGGSDVISANFESKWLSVPGVGTPSQKFRGITFSIDSLEGMFIVITVLIAFIILLGIQFLATGLSPSSVKMVSVLTAYGGIWIVLTELSIGLIKSIEIFGALLYISLTIVYIIGITQKHIGV